MLEPDIGAALRHYRSFDFWAELNRELLFEVF